MKYIKNISFFLVTSLIVVLISQAIESTSVFKYLQENIIGLLLTLLAINIASSGLIAAKIQDILVEFPKFDFSESLKEMKISLLEQVILLGVSIITLIVSDSLMITYVHKELIGNTILFSILIYAINILWDTGQAVFIIIDQLQQLYKERRREEQKKAPQKKEN